MKQLFNHRNKKEYRRNLRNNLTTAKAFFWLRLKNKQLAGRRFKRQVSVGHYIVDFYCPSEKLVIELDGQRHFTTAGYKYDQHRDKYLNSLGLRVIRFENKEVFQNLQEVLDDIRNNFK
jgi:very-short-patch-repair endonuclease